MKPNEGAILLKSVLQTSFTSCNSCEIYLETQGIKSQSVLKIENLYHPVCMFRFRNSEYFVIILLLLLQLLLFFLLMFLLTILFHTQLIFTCTTSEDASQFSSGHPASIISAQTKALVPSSRDPSHGPTLFITVVTDSFRLWVLDLKRCNYWAISPSQLLSIWPPGKQIVRRVEGEDFFFFFLGGRGDSDREREREAGRKG